MPIYELYCKKCGKKHEIWILKTTDKAPSKCSCGGTLKKGLSVTNFSGKGDGWVGKTKRKVINTYDGESKLADKLY